MKSSKRYSEAPREIARAIKEATVVTDFLPPPAELQPREELTKVTIALTSRSVDFFKEQASGQEVPYQTLIRKVLDLYARRYKAK